MLAVIRLLRIVLGVLLSLGASMANAQTAYIFDGRAIPRCTLSAKTYNCTSLPLSHYQDRVEIANDYQVNSDTDIVFGFNQGLKMSGTARLVSYGDLDISGIQSSLLNITGGSFLTDKTFRMGAQSQNITLGHIQADHIYLGTGSTGSVTATLQAVRSVTIAHGMTLTGNITAADVNVLPSSGLVNGNITASGTVYLGSTARVNGNVIADTLSTQAANAYVSGNATVRLAILEHAARVAGKIYCTKGNASGSCDCVLNNSGNAINTPTGPNCPATARTGANHIRIEHPISAPTCAPAKVTLKACANAACSSLYTGGETVTLEPGSATFDIGSSGILNDATVSQRTAGIATIRLNQVPFLPYTCAGNGATAANDCKINFTSAALVVNVADHRSEVATPFTIQAIKAVGSGESCGPAVSGAQNVTLKCIYSTPNTGTRPVRINGGALNAAANLTGACDATGRTVSMTFDSAGSASGTLIYADAGAVTLTAAVAAPTMNGQDTFIAAPASFTIARSGSTTDLIRAGEGVAITVAARNELKAITPNFTGAGLEVVLAPKLCKGSGTSGVLSLNVVVDPAVPTKVRGFSGGVHGVMPPATPVTAFTWNEVGSMDIIATMDKYLDYTVRISGNSNQTGTDCSNQAGVFNYVPHHFDTVVSQPAKFSYSGQPVTIASIKAMNSANQLTVNYSSGIARDVTLTAPDIENLNPAPGTWRTVAGATPVSVAGIKFVAGEATNVQAVYTFASKRTKPTTIRVRAVEPIDKVSSETGVEGTAQIRSGRLRLFSAFGRAGAPLSIPYRVEYWSGSSWLTNLLHTTPIPQGSVALTLIPLESMRDTRLTSVTTGTGQQAGQGSFLLTPPARSASTGIGTVDVAVNLGATAKDNACLGNHPDKPGAAQPWLRTNNGACATSDNIDPSVRATFGIIAPESRRVIHTREVFR